MVSYTTFEVGVDENHSDWVGDHIMLMDESQRLKCVAQRHFKAGIVSQEVIEAVWEFDWERSPAILCFQDIYEVLDHFSVCQNSHVLFAPVNKCEIRRNDEPLHVGTATRRCFIFFLVFIAVTI